MQPPVAIDWSVLIPLIFTGIALLITTSVSAWNSTRVKKDVRTNAAAGAEAGAERDRKLDNITVLVNGRYSLVLQELADVKRQLASVTGREIDRVAAALAQQAADEQAARVVAPPAAKES